MRCHVFIGGLGQQRFSVDTLCKRCGLLTFQVGIQASSALTPFVLARDPVLVRHLFIGAGTLVDRSSFVGHGFRKVTQMHHVILSSLQISRDHRFGDRTSVLNQRWVLEATFTALVESNLTRHSVHCIRDVALCHGSNQSLTCHQAHTLCFRQFDLASISHGQGVFDHILSQGLRRILGSGVDFRDVVQAHLGQHWCFCHHLAHLCLGLYHLLGTSNVAHGLEDAGQVLALWRPFSQALHDSADFRNLGQAFHPVFHLIEVGHGLDELRCHAGVSRLLGHAQHLICHGHKCLGHVAGSAQLGLQFFRQQALGHIFFVGVTKGEC